MQAPTIPRTSRHYTATLPGLLVIIGLLILGCFICKDYGVSWDEISQRQIGDVNLQFVRTGDDALMTGFADKDHGAAFELPLKWIEEVVSPREFGTVIHIRHLCSFLLYLGGIWCGYLLGLRLFRKQWIALTGMAMLVLQPRIFAHAFFNSKDVPFLAAMLIGLYAVHAAFAGRRAIQYGLAGAAFGYAAGIRTMGALPIILTIVLLLIAIIREPRRERAKTGMRLLQFSASAMAMLYLCWPALWHHPLDSLWESYEHLSRFTRWESSLLFNGTVYPGSALPWYYIPEWFCISTPVCWLLLGIAGILLGCVHFIKRPIAVFETPKAKVLLLCAACFALPVLAVIALHSVLYDDWRHLYFIYPPFVMMALYAVERIAESKPGKAAALAGCGIQAVATVAFMVSAHPFQQVYFNPLVSHAPEYLRRHFDYEYWGTSYKQGLEYLLAHDSRDTISVVRSEEPLNHNGRALPDARQRRIRWTADYEHGAYFLTTYRGHPEDFAYSKVWRIAVGGSTAMQIYRIDTNGKQ